MNDKFKEAMAAKANRERKFLEMRAKHDPKALAELTKLRQKEAKQK